ncbi:MAG: SAM-dependent methyltransferase [Marinosulfonomonas sp.]|nr:SAM-dependent methyltransferase [Marinosulfonomonas sp.]
MSPLGEILRRRIAQNGPISIADYMAECLMHPQHGYYTTRPVFGVAGDFTTAPEISQMFGELLGLSLAQCWIDQGQPDRFILAEAGPGRGTLMADILRATANIPGFHDGAEIHLIEVSKRLRKVQRATLQGHDVTWLDTIDALPDAPLFLVANEFFDALPIRQFTRDARGWREHQIGLDNDDLVLGLSAPAPIGLLDHRLDDTTPGDIVEVCPAAGPIIAQIANRISTSGGAALIVDYGEPRSLGDTFQAVAEHQPVGVLENPGQADLSAHVDFENLTKAAHGVSVSDLVPQGVLLERLGIAQRAQHLAANLTGAALESHVAAHRRLTHPDEMGTLFKAIAVFPNDLLPPPGFTHDA